MSHVVNVTEELIVGSVHTIASGSTTTTTGSINAGSTTLTVTSIQDFALYQGIQVDGAGNGGAHLITKITGISGTTITLRDAAGTSKTNTTVRHLDRDNHMSHVINVKEELIVGSVHTIASGSTTTTTGSINAGSTTLTVTSIQDFALYQGIQVDGAGNGGAHLITKITGISGTTITLRDAAGTSKTNTTVRHHDREAIQAALDAAGAQKGWTVVMSPGNYFLGTGDPNNNGRGLKIPSGVTFQGTGIDPDNAAPVKGSLIKYNGTGVAILVETVKHVVLSDFLIDLRNATGASIRGIHLHGAWFTTLRNLRFKVPSNGLASGAYAILTDTFPGAIPGPPSQPWGAQHIYFERVSTGELTATTADNGVIRFQGASDTDQITTTVLNTVYARRYEVDQVSSITFINSTAEGFGANEKGFTIQNCDQANLLGVDIESPFATSTSIGISLGTKVRHFLGIGVNFLGLPVAAKRIDGSPSLPPPPPPPNPPYFPDAYIGGLLLQNYSEPTFWGSLGDLSATRYTLYDASANVFVEIGARNYCVNQNKAFKYRWIVEGDANNQILKLRTFRQPADLSVEPPYVDPFVISDNVIQITTNGALRIDGTINGTTATSATAGSASSLPSVPAGYLVVKINGTDRKVPFYAM